MAAEVFSSQGKPYCSDLSIRAEEPLTATATPTTVFLLLEYNGAWGEKALDESELPQPIKTRLSKLILANVRQPLASLLPKPKKIRRMFSCFLYRTMLNCWSSISMQF